MKKRLLLTYASYGNGHRAIADYIKNYFKEQDPEIEILSIDLLEYSTPILGKLGQKISMFFMLKMPHCWSLIYDLSDTNLQSKIVNETSLTLFKNKKMRKVISEFNPDLTISTHFFGSSLIDFYNRKGLINSKLITVVTDYEAHALWLRGHKREQAIIVGAKDEARKMIKYGVSKNKIKTIGIPINPNVAQNIDIMKTTEKYGLSGIRPICLFFGGGGAGGTHSIPYVQKIMKMNLNIDFIYIAGKNNAAKEKVDAMIKKYGATNFKTMGFVTNVPELLQISDFVISKPGGAQTTECLYFNKPVIMINCSGGQEIGNVKYFEENGYGKSFRTTLMFGLYLKQISDNPKILDNMRKKMSKNKNSQAMEKLYDIAVDILNGK